MKISKIEAAKYQLIESIRLFFEERDPVSIHTLTGAALDVLNDHITDKGLVWDHNLFFHPESIYIKDEHRKEFQDHIRKNKNFFKHADRDIKAGIHEIEFDPGVNEAYIFEAIRALAVVAPGFRSCETDFFTYWLLANHPHWLKDGNQNIVALIRKYGLTTKKECLKAINTIRNGVPDYMEFIKIASDFTGHPESNKT